MNDRLALIVYLAAVVGATLVHSIPVLALGIGAVMLLARHDAAKIVRRALLAIIVFNLMISVSYVVIALIQDRFAWDYLFLMNLRVFLITCMTFLFVERVNPFKALAFSPSLSYLLTLAYTQLLTFRRIYHDMRLALTSRSLERLRMKQLYRHGAASGSFFVEKALSNASESAQAMRSRGFFNDQV